MKKIYIVALLFALVAGIAVYMFAASLKADATPAPVATSTVVAAAAEIPEGTFITAEMLKYVTVPAELAAAGSLTSVEQAIGKVNRYTTPANAQVVSSQLGSSEEAAVGEGGQLSYALKEGTRAMTVSVGDTSGVAGYINPGDCVDIICSYSVETKDGEGNVISSPVTAMLFENIRVLETGLMTTNLSDQQAGTTTQYSLLTLEVTSEEALKLQFAMTNGSLNFVLRPVGDAEKVAPKDCEGLR